MVGPGARLSSKVPGDDASIEQRGGSVLADRQEAAGGRGKTKDKSNQPVKGRGEGEVCLDFLFVLCPISQRTWGRVDLSTVASLVGVSLAGSRVWGGSLGEGLGPHGLLRGQPGVEGPGHSAEAQRGWRVSQWGLETELAQDL